MVMIVDHDDGDNRIEVVMIEISMMFDDH